MLLAVFNIPFLVCGHSFQQATKSTTNFVRNDPFPIAFALAKLDHFHRNAATIWLQEQVHPTMVWVANSDASTMITNPISQLWNIGQSVFIDTKNNKLSIGSYVTHYFSRVLNILTATKTPLITKKLSTVNVVQKMKGTIDSIGWKTKPYSVKCLFIDPNLSNNGSTNPHRFLSIAYRQIQISYKCVTKNYPQCRQHTNSIDAMNISRWFHWISKGK